MLVITENSVYFVSGGIRVYKVINGSLLYQGFFNGIISDEDDDKIHLSFSDCDGKVSISSIVKQVMP